VAVFMRRFNVNGDASDKYCRVLMEIAQSRLKAAPGRRAITQRSIWRIQDFVAIRAQTAKAAPLAGVSGAPRMSSRRRQILALTWARAVVRSCRLATRSCGRFCRKTQS
jgi:hypothetical protein